MDFAVYVTGRMLSVIPALWFVGWLLKRLRRVPDGLIPFILAVLGVVAALIIDGPSANSVVQGLLAAAAAVMGHQAVKQGAEIVGDAPEPLMPGAANDSAGQADNAEVREQAKPQTYI
ncbi:MAG: phage holin family protein [Candidatus Fimadaptatus sp.]|jgi:hypothetical protein